MWSETSCGIEFDPHPTPPFSIIYLSSTAYQDPMPDDGKVEVRVGPDGKLYHRHPGYEGWHPVKQKHKNPKLHEQLGITGNEKPNRRSKAGSIGVKDPGEKRKPSKPKTVGTGGKPAWSWDDSKGVGEYLKQYANVRPKSFIGRHFVNAVNATSWMLNMFRNRLDEKNAELASQGYEDALRAFDSKFTFHGTDDFDKLTVDDIRRIDRDLVDMAREKYNEYGGAELKGKNDAESLRRKAEIRTYIELRNRLREKAKRDEEKPERYKPRTSYSNTSNMSVSDLRQRARQRNSK